MKINSIKIKNVKSIGEKISVSFEKGGLNILIGTNGGGKSNLMDIINIVLNTYFVWHCQRHKEAFRTIYQFEQLDNFFDLPKHDDFPDDANQEIEIEFEFSEDDFNNIEIIRNNLQKIIETEKSNSGNSNSDLIENFEKIIANVSSENLKGNHIQKFILSAQSFDRDTANKEFNSNSYSSEQKVFFRYLNYFEKIKYLIEDYNEDKPDDKKIPELKYNWKFFSPYRFHEGQSFRVSLVGKNRTAILKDAKSKTSSKASSDVDYFTFHFSKLFNDLAIKNQSLIDDKEKCSARSFSDMNEIKEVKKLLNLIGDYDFQIKPASADDNVFKFIIKTEGKEIDFNKLSSGEKEIFNFIFSIAALDLRNAVVIVDEPEIHLHPQWQAKLIYFYREIAKERNLQFVMATHSPGFVNSETIADIARIYKEKRQTKIIPEEKTKEWVDGLGKQKDLIDIITFSNNAKLFFTDNVLLVEGITDEIIFNFLLKEFNDNRKNIEVVAVNGKDNFPKYISFLGKFKIKPIVIADLDNLGSGKLLNGQNIIAPIRSEVGSKKNGDFESVKGYLDAEEVKNGITKEQIGIKILKIIEKLNKGESVDETNKNFLEHWLEKCVDTEKIIKGLDIKEAYKQKDSSIKSLNDILNKLNDGIEIEEEKCSVFILEEGKIEDYYEEGGKNKKGKGTALEFLSSLKKYAKEKKDAEKEGKELEQKNDKFEYLIELTKKMLSSLQDPAKK